MGREIGDGGRAGATRVIGMEVATAPVDILKVFPGDDGNL